MTKWQEKLKQRALNGDQAASDIYRDTDGMDEGQLAQYLVENDERVRKALGMKYLAEKGAKETYDPSLVKEYYDLLNRGKMAFQGEGRFDPYGNSVTGLDEYMEKFGVKPEEGGYTDDQRAAFTNPENSNYFGKIKTPDQLREIAVWMGKDDPSSLVEDLRRTGDAWQRANRVEGWGPNNEFTLGWFKSALKGLAAPRVKEAELAGREPNWKDISGDLVELGLSVVPGVGIVSKSGKLIARLPKWPARGLTAAAYGADAAAVPAGSQAYDIAVNDEGPRSTWDWTRFGAQTGLMGAGKAATKQFARGGKDIMEGSLGARAGGSEFNDGKGFIESIGEKTDDLIARRQAMLDRKAELAGKRSNVNLPGDMDIKAGGFSVDDLIDADNYRILAEEANRIGKSAGQRKAFNEAVAPLQAAQDLGRKSQEILREMEKEQWKIKALEDAKARGNTRAIAELTPGVESYYKNFDRLSAIHDLPEAKLAGPSYQGADKVNAAGAAFSAYRKANEAGARDIVQLPDGRFAYADRVGPDGLRYPGAEYAVPVEGAVRPAEFRYPAYDTEVPAGTVDRNRALKEAIDRDPLVSRKLESGNYRKELARDVLASMGFTAASHNDLIGKLNEVEAKRADAYWNSQLRKLSDLTSSKYDPATRRENFEAVMDALSYGLDNVPDDKFRKRPETYHAIAAKLGNPGWKHPSETREVPVPATSYSTAQ